MRLDKCGYQNYYSTTYNGNCRIDQLTVVFLLSDCPAQFAIEYILPGYLIFHDYDYRYSPQSLLENVEIGCVVTNSCFCTNDHLVIWNVRCWEQEPLSRQCVHTEWCEVSISVASTYPATRQTRFNHETLEFHNVDATFDSSLFLWTDLH